MVRCRVVSILLLMIFLEFTDGHPSHLREERSTSFIDCTNYDYVETTTEEDDEEIEDTEYVPERECGPQEGGFCANKSGCKLHWAPLAKRWDPVCNCSEGWMGQRCNFLYDVWEPVKNPSRFNSGYSDPGYWGAYYDRINRAKLGLGAMLNPLLSGVLDLATVAPVPTTTEEIIEDHPDRKCEHAESELCKNKASCLWMTWAPLAKRWEPVCACTKDYLGPRCEEIEIYDGSIRKSSK